jgi:hypothetical protein
MFKFIKKLFKHKCVFYPTGNYESFDKIDNKGYSTLNAGQGQVYQCFCGEKFIKGY